MSFLTVNHEANIDRIIAILKTDPTIFDGSLTTTLIRKIFFAEPNYNMEDDSTPYIYVQIAEQYQFTKEPYGTQVADYTQALAAYNVVVVTQKKQAEQTQRDLFKWTNLIVKRLKSFPLLDDPVAPGTDKKVVRTNIISISRREAIKGMEKDGAVITLQVQIGSSWQFQLPDGTKLDLLTKPVENFDLDTDDDILDDSSFSITGKKTSREISVEFESTPALDALILGFLDGGEHTVNLLHAGITRSYVAVLVNTSKPVPFDNVERTILTVHTLQ